MKKYFVFAALALGLVLPKLGLAATFSVTLNKSVISIGDTFSATVKIDSEGAGVNAGQATINFSTNTLQVVSIDQSNSVFDFWLQNPAFDNSAGTVTFIGGSTAGFIGSSLQALTINFKATGSGPANLSFSDGAITASDGSGTNLLSAMTGAQFTIGTKTGVPVPASPVQPAASSTPVVLPPPPNSDKKNPRSSHYGKQCTSFNCGSLPRPNKMEQCIRKFLGYLALASRRYCSSDRHK